VDSVHDESYCSAITADSVHDPQPHLDCLDNGPMGVVPHNNPKLAQGRDNSSRSTHSCISNNPAKHRLSAVNPRDAAGSLSELGPCGPCPTVPTADAGMGPGGEPPTQAGHHCHAEHDGTGHFAGPTMLFGKHWSSSGIINDMNGGSNTSKTASGMTITSGVLDEHRKCIVPRSSHRDGGGSPSDVLQPAPMTNEQADQFQYDAMSGPSPEENRVGQAQVPITQITLIHDPSGRAGQKGNVRSVFFRQ
jgi:hypothetical protein